MPGPTTRCGRPRPAAIPASASRCPPRTAGSSWSRRSRARRPRAPGSGPATSCSRSTASPSRPTGSRRPSAACAARSARRCGWRSAARASPSRCCSPLRARRGARAHGARRAAARRLRLRADHAVQRLDARRPRHGALRAHAARQRRRALYPLRGLVLDLRGNPGGVLESAVSVADAFLDDGLIVRAEGRTPEARFEMSATAGRRARRRADRRTGRRRLGVGLRDRRRRVARSRSRDAHGRAHLRQGLGADRDPAARRAGAQADDVEVFHALGRLDPRARARARHRDPPARTRACGDPAAAAR